MKKLIYKHLVEQNLIENIPSKNATNSIKILSDKEVVISGNKLGLIELADYIINVALSQTDGYHIHLDETNFFDDTGLEVVISKQEDRD